MDITKEFDECREDNFIRWFVVSAVSGVEKFPEAASKRPLNVTMQVNGAEINPVHALKRLEEQFEYMVAEEAKRLFHSYYMEQYDKLRDLLEDLTDQLTSKAENELKIHVKRPWE